jgi:hypothetical protein
MIEIDEQGKEWFGYSVGGGDLKDEDRAADAVEMTKTMSTYLKRKVAESDRPATVVTAPKLARDC